MKTLQRSIIHGRKQAATLAIAAAATLLTFAGPWTAVGQIPQGGGVSGGHAHGSSESPALENETAEFEVLCPGVLLQVGRWVEGDSLVVRRECWTTVAYEAFVSSLDAIDLCDPGADEQYLGVFQDHGLIPSDKTIDDARAFLQTLYETHQQEIEEFPLGGDRGTTELLFAFVWGTVYAPFTCLYVPEIVCVVEGTAGASVSYSPIDGPPGHLDCSYADLAFFLYIGVAPCRHQGPHFADGPFCLLATYANIYCVGEALDPCGAGRGGPSAPAERATWGMLKAIYR